MFQRRVLRIEQYEKRIALDASLAVEYFPMIMASGVNGINGLDSPSSRISNAHPETGSLSLTTRGSSYLCTGTLIDDPLSVGGDAPLPNQWVLTAAHCLDVNNNGRIDFKPADVIFYPGGRQVTGGSDNGMVAQQLFVHPDFRGFGSGGSVNNDIALIQLNGTAATPPAQLHESEVGLNTEFRMVGFGLSGTGSEGYTTSASLEIKRIGGNIFDDAGEGSGNSLNKAQIWRADFDHPSNDSFSFLGYRQLPYDVETNLGKGDSGGPSHLIDASGVNLGLAAINTFGYSVINGNHGLIDPPYYGSGMGGILLHSYLSWIDGVMTGTTSPPNGGDSGGKGGGKGGGPKSRNLAMSVESIAPPVELHSRAFLDIQTSSRSQDVELLAIERMPARLLPSPVSTVDADGPMARMQGRLRSLHWTEIVKSQQRLAAVDTLLAQGFDDLNPFGGV